MLLWLAFIEHHMKHFTSISQLNPSQQSSGGKLYVQITDEETKA